MNNIRVEVSDSYIPGEDITVVWNDLIVNGETVQRALVGWYHGEPDASTTELQYGHSPNIANYLL